MNTVTINSPAGLAAAVPYLVGYHPANRLVAIGYDASTVAVTISATLDDLQELGFADVAGPTLRSQGVTRVLLVGYGPIPVVTPVMYEAEDACRMLGIDIGKALLIDNGCWWTFPATDTDSGTPVETNAPVAAEFVAAGVAPLASRDDVAAQLDRAPADEAVTMPEAVTAARQEIQRRRNEEGDRVLAFEGCDLVRHVSETTYPTQAADMAFLGVVLSTPQLCIPVCTAAMASIANSPTRAVPIWTAIVRQLPDSYRWQAANLAGFAAWKSGDGALAQEAIKLSLCLNASRDNVIGRAMDAVLISGTPPRKPEDSNPAEEDGGPDSTTENP